MVLPYQFNKSNILVIFIDDQKKLQLYICRKTISQLCNSSPLAMQSLTFRGFLSDLPYFYRGSGISKNAFLGCFKLCNSSPITMQLFTLFYAIPHLLNIFSYAIPPRFLCNFSPLAMQFLTFRGGKTAYFGSNGRF